MENLLTKNYPEAQRPYSQDEISDIRTKSLSRLNVGDTMVFHEGCCHFYLAKAGGKKEAQVKEEQTLDTGCCSVCWKLRKTPKDLRKTAEEMVEAFNYNFSERPDRWSLSLLHLEITYYKWLYINFERRNRRDGDRDGDRYRDRDRDRDTMRENIIKRESFPELGKAS